MVKKSAALHAIMCVFLLAGCVAYCEPNIKPVQKNQDYKLPKLFIVRGYLVSREKAVDLCGVNTYGCTKYALDGSVVWYYSSKNVLVHEAAHLAYGPEH